MGRVVHFEINVPNPSKEVEFFKNVFGWNFLTWEGQQDYWLIMTGDRSSNGIDGGLANSGDKIPSIVNTIEVENINDTIEKIKSNGGSVITEIMTIPTIGLLAYFKDVEGMVHGILQEFTQEK
jgi:uncharacterized protein